MLTDRTIDIIEDAPIPTWFRVGGTADAMARPREEADLAACLAYGGPVRVLGEGANLLVDDAGIDGLVVRLDAPRWKRVEIDPSTGFVRAGAGVDLRRLINATTRAGLAGLERLGGIPATIGGAVRMNAGGRYGEIGEFLRRLWLLDGDGRARTLERDGMRFGYRSFGTTSGELAGAIVTGVELALTPDRDPRELRARYASIIAGKSESQPMAQKSAGCCFKNPTLEADVPGLGARGERVGAGLLIDRAGCKAMQLGGARVSDVHANFITTSADARARDIIELMDAVAERVRDRFGVQLEREVVVWSRSP